MQIFVDADACPVVAIIEKIAKDNSVPVMLLCDTNHVLSSTYSKVVVVGAGADAVDAIVLSPSLSILAFLPDIDLRWYLPFLQSG